MAQHEQLSGETFHHVVGPGAATHYHVPGETKISARLLPYEDLIIFSCALILVAFVAWLFAAVYKLYEVDALARIFQAASVFYDDPPKLANIGFIWPPIQNLVQLPFVAIRPLAREGLAAPIVTALFSAGDLVLLNRILADLSQPRRLRYPVLVLYQTNVMIFIYSTNGMSEMIMMFWVLVTIYYLQRLMAGKTSEASALAMIGICSGLGFLTRYEGFIFGAALYATFLIYWLGVEVQTNKSILITIFRNRSDAGVKEFFAKIEARSLYFLTPWIFSIVIWIFFNWIIMGNPLNFLVGKGSNSELARINLVGNTFLLSLYKNISGSFQYIILLAWNIYPGFFVALPGLSVAFLWKRSFYALGLVILLLSFPLFQVGMLFKGQSFGWMRFIIYVIPISLIGLALLNEKVKQSGLIPAWAADVALIALLIASSLGTYRGVYADNIIDAHERRFLETLLQQRVTDNFGPDRDVGSYIDTHILGDHPNMKILADDQQSLFIILMSDAYRNFISTRQPAFVEALEHPQGNVDYVLIPGVDDGTNLIITQYPGIIDGKVPFLKLVKTFPGTLVPEWRLFQVLPTGASAPDVADIQQSPPATPTPQGQAASTPASTAPAALPTAVPAAPPAAGAAPTIVPTPAPAADQWAVIAQERFERVSEHWPIIKSRDWSASYSNGRYQMRLDGRRSMSYSMPLPARDFELDADVQIGRGQAGLFFLIEKPNDFYRFLIDARGHYRLEWQQVGVSKPLIDWTASDALRQGARAINRIAARRVGDELSLYANGALLGTYRLPPGNAAQGRVGLALDAPGGARGAAAWFDNLVVRGPKP